MNLTRDEVLLYVHGIYDKPGQTTISTSQILAHDAAQRQLIAFLSGSEDMHLADKDALRKRALEAEAALNEHEKGQNCEACDHTRALLAEVERLRALLREFSTSTRAWMDHREREDEWSKTDPDTRRGKELEAEFMSCASSEECLFAKAVRADLARIDAALKEKP